MDRMYTIDERYLERAKGGFCKNRNRISLKMDPRTNIFLTITVSCILVSGSVSGIMSIVRLCLAFLPLILLLSVNKYRMVAKYGGIYIAAYLAERFLLQYTTGGINILLITIIGLVTHIMPGLIMGFYFMQNTEVSEFIASMERMGVTNKIVLPLCVVFRFFPTVKEEYDAIRNGMKMQGITFLSLIVHPIKFIEYQLVPLIISVVKIGEELMVASLTRGLGAPNKRTNICQAGFKRIDVLFLTMAFVSWIIFWVTK
jgi:energy-coupling factor transporter transmembrane protein EcfT